MFRIRVKWEWCLADPAFIKDEGDSTRRKINGNSWNSKICEMGGGNPVNQPRTDPLAMNSEETAGTGFSDVPFLRGFSRSAKQDSEARCKGFTLVEVIVVIVIIAILAAIGVPALTGYIDKAQDRKWIAQARDIAIASRTVVTEAYADGVFNQPGNANLASYIAIANDGSEQPNRRWNLNGLWIYSHYNNFDYTFSFKSGELSGTPFILDTSEGYWTYDMVGPKDMGPFNADAFIWCYYPEGYDEAAPVIVVTYKLDRVTADDGTYEGTYEGTMSILVNELFYGENDCYNPNAGYEVYHVQFFY
jgi:prepilin-type N-terminal cleavage/methylation domain-containing protein